MTERIVVIDARGHMLGRLAATISKQLLFGKRITVVRAEELLISGPVWRNSMKFAFILRKRTNTNPKKGPFHYRQPSNIFWKIVRGMLPHKTQRGAAALRRLKIVEGIPPPYDTQKRYVVPSALRSIRIRPGRRVTKLSELAENIGWKHKDVLEKLEEKRKLRAAAYYTAKKARVNLQKKAVAAARTEPSLAESNKLLTTYGY